MYMVVDGRILVLNIPHVYNVLYLKNGKRC